MMKSRPFWVAVILVLGDLLILQPALGEAVLSDRQKKEVVYQIYADYKKDFPTVKDMSPRQTMELMNNTPVVFVDTRKPAEIKVSMLPNAVTKKKFMHNPNVYKEKTVVVYCTAGYRSGVFARQMAEKGITTYNLQGGILAWTLEGGKIYDANGETKRIHVFGKKWDYAPDGYAVVMFGIFGMIF
jgi:sodium/bile acid cotransporter 7